MEANESILSLVILKSVLSLGWVGTSILAVGWGVLSSPRYPILGWQLCMMCQLCVQMDPSLCTWLSQPVFRDSSAEGLVCSF